MRQKDDILGAVKIISPFFSLVFDNLNYISLIIPPWGRKGFSNQSPVVLSLCVFREVISTKEGKSRSGVWQGFNTTPSRLPARRLSQADHCRARLWPRALQEPLCCRIFALRLYRVTWGRSWTMVRSQVWFSACLCQSVDATTSEALSDTDHNRWRRSHRGKGVCP